ncbi:cyclic pyranopterin monophosphate synthase MoaC [Bacillus sp. CLL-7-23]|uniref:Cyclic pyranopterin monophosphate synthase n=1 Tax=Bacillus changyiensis TaxID=3004103 RepID=A0ABT4X8G5_9BACI|nr:cyclic pyranopterin monophosphate synthase MoaC [Bacillus changyiensis]MDA7028586.1 cyclic pyranopterin monophosphate synthase MoaC [Bacillus changyiensis]
MNEFTHFNEQGRARMVDISEKEASVRIAVAVSSVTMSKLVYESITNQQIGKGDVLAVAQVAGIMAAKQTSDMIPMCHPIALKGVDISFQWEEKEAESILHIRSMVKTKGSTGVEMEALTSVSVCALTVYDMCKAVDKGMVIGPTALLEKTGGKSGDFKRGKVGINTEDHL